jgi:aminoglycoside 3-N-acetyltransferase
MTEQEKLLITQPRLVRDFEALGIKPGMTLVVHSSLKSLGDEVNGGAVAVILALEQVLTTEGTLVMPTHTAVLSDPARWVDPPVPEAWWEEMRRTMPAFDPALTPVFRMGVIPETFRKQTGVLRSNHPDASFAAWGKHARMLTEDQPLTPIFGEGTPLARMYHLDGWVLLLGVGHGNNTSLHVAEARARIEHGVVNRGAPIMVDGVRQWVTFDDPDWDDGDFADLGADFARETGLQREGKVGRADCILVPQRPLIDYGVTWLERKRGKI